MLECRLGMELNIGIVMRRAASRADTNTTRIDELLLQANEDTRLAWREGDAFAVQLLVSGLPPSSEQVQQGGVGHTRVSWDDSSLGDVVCEADLQEPDPCPKKEYSANAVPKGA